MPIASHRSSWACCISSVKKLSGEHVLPDDDHDFDSKVLSDARTRSQEIRDAAALVAGTERHERIHAVPLWLKLCWIVAILAVIALVIYSQSQGAAE